MIDYDKLKEACELASMLEMRCSIEVCFFNNYACKFVFNAPTPDDNFCKDNIDDFISKLKELTKPEPKYERGQNVWHLRHNEIIKAQVIEVYWDDDLNDYRLTLIEMKNGKISIGQSLVYPTREDVILAQITYWQDMQDETVKVRDEERFVSEFGSDDETKKYYANFGCKEECHHESLSKSEAQVCYTQNGPVLKCNKCGEFYK